MFLVLWEFEVKPGNEERFERVYGAGGDWDSLFVAIRIMRERTCSETWQNRGCTSLPTTG